MSDCREMELLISAAMDEELSEGEFAMVRAHLESCAACRDLRGEWEELDRQLAAPPWVPSPADLDRVKTALDAAGRASVFPRVAGLSVAAMVLIALTLSWAMTTQSVTARTAAEPWEALRRIQRVQDRAQTSLLKTYEWDLRTMKLELEQSPLEADRKSALTSRIEDLMRRVQQVQQESLDQGIKSISQEEANHVDIP